MNWDGVLARFGEIGIKSPYVRREMVERLRTNILDLMESESVEGDVVSIGSRLWLAGPDAQRLLDVACRTFGVVSASLARRLPPTPEAILPEAAAAALTRPWSSFAVRAKREGDHPFTSMELAKEAGSAIFRAAEAAGRTPKVDLAKPDLEVHIDVRAKQAFLYLDTREGPGGLPVSTQGAVLARIESPADAFAAWLLMRRGCALHAASLTPGSPDHPAAVLRAWGWRRALHPLRSSDPADLQSLARSLRAVAVVTGDGLPEMTGARDPPGGVVLRPLAGLSPSFASELAARHGLVTDG